MMSCKQVDLSTDVSVLLQGAPKQPATRRTLAHLCCFLRQGFVSDAETLHAEHCGFNLSPQALQAAIVASTNMVDNLRSFAATYIPISDLYDEGGRRSATLCAIEECYNIQADFDLLRSAVTAHMDDPVPPEGMARWREEGKESLQFVFLSRQFGLFYEVLCASAAYLRYVAQYS